MGQNILHISETYKRENCDRIRVKQVLGMDSCLLRVRHRSDMVFLYPMSSQREKIRHGQNTSWVRFGHGRMWIVVFLFDCGFDDSKTVNFIKNSPTLVLIVESLSFSPCRCLSDLFKSCKSLSPRQNPHRQPLSQLLSTPPHFPDLSLADKKITVPSPR